MVDSRFIDHAGQRFDRLLVIERGHHPTKAGFFWWCRCDCGNKKLIRGGDLRSGRTISCGCHTREITTERWRRKRAEWVGRRIGAVTVVRDAGKSKRGRPTWECHCDCGNVVFWELCNLVRGQQSCGCRALMNYARGPRHGNWKGGRIVRRDGYAMLKKPEHPNAQKGGYVLEHIWVMSEHLKRPIRKTEEVHHKNGIKDDNRLENLELWVCSHPKGQRPQDLVEFARAILRDYGAEFP